GFNQGRQGATVAVETETSLIFILHYQFAGPDVHPRHGTLGQEMDLLGSKSKEVVLGEKIPRRLIRRRAGHDQKRNFNFIALRKGQNFLGVNLEEGFLRYRTNGVHSLGLGKAQAGPLPTGDDQERNLTLA